MRCKVAVAVRKKKSLSSLVKAVIYFFFSLRRVSVECRSVLSVFDAFSRVLRVYIEC